MKPTHGWVRSITTYDGMATLIVETEDGDARVQIPVSKRDGTPRVGGYVTFDFGTEKGTQ